MCSPAGHTSHDQRMAVKLGKMFVNRSLFKGVSAEKERLASSNRSADGKRNLCACSIRDDCMSQHIDTSQQHSTLEISQSLSLNILQL
jgi:hypothetical protein